MQSVAIQINTKDSLKLSFSARERKALAKSVGGAFNVFWLPPKERDRRPDVSGSHVTTTIFLFLLGLPVSAAFGAFFKSFFSEAGKDTYSHLKKLITKIWKKQLSKTYALGATAYVIFEFQEEHIAFQFSTGRLLNLRVSTKELERLIEQDVVDILNSLDDIERDIRKFRIGKSGRPYQVSVHLIAPYERGKWRIDAVDNWHFFNS